MNLMNMVRLFGLLLIGWAAVALGIGLCRGKGRPAAETNFYLPEPALHEAVPVSRSKKIMSIDEYRLVDRSTGKAKRLTLPRDANWELVSVSPWRDEHGNLEAVGRWSRPGAGGEQSSCGLALFRLSDAKVVHSIDLDVLPTGKPCWVPGRPGDILFPAGDGQLHRSHLARERAAQSQASEDGGAPARSAQSARSYPVAWGCAVPGSGTVFIADPVWPPEKPLQKFVFVSLSPQSLEHGILRNDPAQIWWLEMTRRGDEILSAGRLTRPSPGNSSNPPVAERMPSVSVDPSGRLALAYLARASGEPSWRLCLAAITIEEATGKPRIAGVVTPSEELSDGLLPMPPTFSTDGQAVFASSSDGQIKTYSLETFRARRKPAAVR
jgi:hypothetical protein